MFSMLFLRKGRQTYWPSQIDAKRKRKEEEKEGEGGEGGRREGKKEGKHGARLLA